MPDNNRPFSNEQKMTGTRMIDKAVPVIVMINAAITNIRLYPSSSALVANSIDRVHPALLEILEQEDSVIFAEAEKNLLVFGQSLNEKDQQKPQVIAFLELMLNFGVSSITFEKGLDKTELKSFLEILSKKPEDVEKEGGLQQTITRKKFPHILLNQKVFVAMGKDQQVLAAEDRDVVNYVVGNSQLSDVDIQKVKNMAENPEWISGVFRSSMEHVKEKEGDTQAINISETFSRMMKIFDKISDKVGKDKISQNIAHSIADMDDETLSLVLTQKMDGVLNGELFGHIVDQLDDDKFQRIEAKIKEMDDSTINNRRSGEDRRQEHALDYFAKGGTERRKRKEQRKKQLIHIKAGLNSVLKGEKEVFEDKQVMQSLPGAMEQLLSKGKNKTAEAIIEKVGDALLSEKSDARFGAAQTLSVIGEKLVYEEHPDEMSKLSHKLTNWINIETEVTPAYEKICVQLQDLAQALIRDLRLVECSHILETFSSIHCGKVAKDETIQILSGNVLKNIATDEIVDLLLKEFRTDENNNQEQAANSLTLLGKNSAGALLNLLRESRDMSERNRIVQAISKIGNPASPAVIEQIEQGGPWYYLRNLAAIMGKIGAEADLQILKPLLAHEDFRVQREALNSIYNIGGEYRAETLLSVLSSADYQIKVNIVTMLGALKYRDATAPLLDLLKSKSIITSKGQDQLQEKICVALGSIGSQEAIPALRTIVEQKSLLGLKTSNPKVKAAAAAAILNISREVADAKKRVKPKKKVAAPSADAGLAESDSVKKEAGNLHQQLEQVDQYVGENNNEAAVKLLFDFIVKYAREKNFPNAEVLREKLYEVDPMALTEIVRAGEIIEEEKSESIDQDHLDIWPKLYDTLSTEEANALFYALAEEIYDAGRTIMKQGELNSKLYFVNQGQLKVVYSRDGREILIKNLSTGELAGEDSFFSLSVCTTSIITLSQVKLNVLDKAILQKWKDEYPSLESKLHDYCLKLEKTNDLLKKKGMDRRSQKRVNLSGKVSIQLLSASGSPVGKSFGGELSDVSAGGLSFYIKTAKKETASLLLGRNLNIKFILSAGKSQHKIDQNGKVIGVHYHLLSDYSIHMSFDKMLDENMIEEIENV